MTTDFSNSSAILATVSSLLEAEGLTEAARVLKTADARFENTGYDNWNGGIDLYTLFLQVDATIYARLGSEREGLEQQITERLKPVIDGFSDDWVSAQIRPRVEGRIGWKSLHKGLTEITRRDICDYFTVSGLGWWGDLEECEFLSRLYNLGTLPSTDSRFKTAARDIFQHRSNNDDWPNDWVFSDSRFELAESDEKLLRFLAETLHPAVRRDRQQVTILVSELNKRLNPDGWVSISVE